MNKQNKSQLKPSVIGVDLGSFETKISGVDKGVVDIITNEANFRQTPTSIAYSQNQRFIGEQANTKIKSNYLNTIVSPNRFLGVQQSQVQLQNDFTPNQCKIQEGKAFFNVRNHGREEKLTSQQLIGAFLTKVENIVKINKLQCKNMVLTVPNYYTHHQRKSLLNAVAVANKKQHHKYSVQLINEVEAIGLDYGFYKRLQFSEKEEEGRNIIFVDFGHSKLSLSVVTFTKNYFKVLYQQNHRNLGCRNIDKLILYFYWELLLKQNSQLDASVRNNKKAKVKLLQNIEKQRKILSGNIEYDFNIQCLFEDYDLSYSMKRQQFETLSIPIWTEVKTFLENAKQNIGAIPIHSVELIGGGTRIPMIIKLIHETLGIEPSRTLNSNECIGRGAGLASAMRSSLFKMPGYHAITNNSHKISMKWTQLEQGMHDQNNEVVVYAANESLFTQKEIHLELQNQNQSQIHFVVYENQDQICHFNAKLAPKEGKRAIKFCVKMNSNQMLQKMSAFDEQGNQIKIEQFKFIFKTNLDLINEWENRQLQETMNDIKIMERYEKKNQFQSFLYSQRQQIEATIVNDLKEYVNPEKFNQLIAQLTKIEDELDQIKDYDFIIKELNNKISQYFIEINDSKLNMANFDKQLNNLATYLEALNSRKVKEVRFNVSEEITPFLNWVQEVVNKQKNKPKWEQTVVSLEEIKNVHAQVNQKINDLQAEMNRRERMNQQSFYREPRQPRGLFETNPFGYNQRMFEEMNRPKTRRNSGYNNGFFSNFSNFF